MKSIVYYFSSTGNSLKVARDVAARLPGAELCSIPDAMRSDVVPSSDILGIVFPVHMFGVPRIVERFCRRLRPAGKPYIFGVATYGGLAAGTLRQFQKLLSGRGIELAAGFKVHMPVNYTPFFRPPSPGRQERLFAKAAQRAAEIGQIVSKRLRSGIDVNDPLTNAIFTGFIHRKSTPAVPLMDRHFTTAGGCDGCGVCRQVCPVENIRIENGKPVWLHHCEHCLACLQWCPKEAIDFLTWTRGRKRYRHPDARPEDFKHR
jgi:ferredoxin/flavodoxin